MSTREALRAAKVLEPSDEEQPAEMGEDPTATCEPFFVPRQPVFEDEAAFQKALNKSLE